MSLLDALRGSGRGSLVRSDPAATRSLLAIIAILTFLAGLAAAGAEMVATSSREWQAAVAREATIQLRPQSGRDIEADLARASALAAGAPGIGEARVLSKADAERLLEPWLGTGLDLGSLPVPRLVRLTLSPVVPVDLKALGARLAAEIPGASLDDHGIWLSRLSGVANTILGVAASLVALVLLASGLAVAFATRGAMAGSRAVVDVLHFVGASDHFVAHEFASRFLRLGTVAAAAGGLAACVAVPILAWVAASASGAGAGDPLFGKLGLGWRGYAFILLVALIVAGITGLVSGHTARRFLAQARSG
jgi:cell division transport system permease protein